MNCSTPGLPVHHQLPEFTQTHVHRVGDAIQPSHPLSSPSPPAPVPPSIRVFSNESTLRMRWPKYWSFSFSISPSSEHPGLISFRMNWLHMDVQLFWHCLLKRLSFVQLIPFELLLKISCPCVSTYILESVFYSTDLCAYFYAVPSSFDFCSFKIHPEGR